ncbi:MAG TPA: hypothetical protein VGO40_18645 [Longimicrobium sp.]|nr:hypothetical protein [Longimicrobium sp.]
MKKTMLIAAAALAALPALLAAQTSAKADANVRVRTDASASASRRDRDQGEARSDTRVSAESSAEVRLDASRRALSDGGRRDPSRAETAAGAKAMAAGAAESDLAVLAEHAPRGRSLTASANALARLGAESGDFHSSAAAIAARLEQNASDRAITRLAATGSVDAMLHGADANAAANVAGNSTAGLGGILRGGASVTGGLGARAGGIIP